MDWYLPEVEIITSGRVQLVLNWVDDSLRELSLVWADGSVQEPKSELGRQIKESLDDYLQGKSVVWPDIPMHLHECSEFTRDVLTTLRNEVPSGHTVSYGELAAMAGRPNAARGVGQIMARNRWALLIPCHRVLAANRRIGGYSAQGTEMKLYLLDVEGVDTNTIKLS